MFKKTTAILIAALIALPAFAMDSDGDGMPDSWERKHNLKPNDNTDANGYSLNKQYTNVEIYLNSLLKN